MVCRVVYDRRGVHHRQASTAAATASGTGSHDRHVIEESIAKRIDDDLVPAAFVGDSKLTDLRVSGSSVDGIRRTGIQKPCVARRRDGHVFSERRADDVEAGRVCVDVARQVT